MNRQGFSKRRNNNKHEFPSGLVLLGLFLVAIIWLSVFRPNILETLSIQPASSVFQQFASTATSREAARFLNPIRSPIMSHNP